MKRAWASFALALLAAACGGSRGKGAQPEPGAAGTPATSATTAMSASASPLASTTAPRGAEAKPPTCADLNADDCQRRCDRGDRMACMILADDILDRTTAEGRAKAGALYERICRMKPSDHETPTPKQHEGSAGTCAAAGYLYAGGMHGLRKDPTKAIELWQLGCTRPDDSVSCVVLLNELLRGTQVPRDPRRALAVAPSVCGPDPASDACLVLASMLDRGDGLPKDTKRAAIMFDNACAARKETPERCASLRTSGPKELPGTLHDGVTAACTGADVELAGALKSGQCARAGASAPGPAPRVRTALSAPASPVAPGGVARLVFSIANDGKTDATLRFPLDGAMDTTVVTSVNASGKSTSEPMGKFPGPARDEAAARQQAQLAAVAGATSVIGAMGPSPEAVIVLPPHGRAHMEIAWTAIGSSWGPAVKTKEGTTATLVPTPLPAGSYSVSVELRSTHTTPLPKATAQVTVAR